MKLLLAGDTCDALDSAGLGGARVEGRGHRFVADLRRMHDALRRLLAVFEPEAPMRRRASDAPERAVAPAPPVPGARLLVVADSEIASERTPSSPREGYDYALAVADGGLEALRIAREQGCDTVIVDVNVPDGGAGATATGPRPSGARATTAVLAGGGERADQVAALEKASYADAPYVVLSLVQTQLALKRQKEEIRKLAEALELKNRFIQRTFGRYLSEDVVRELLETPAGRRLGGEERRVTILMADLRGFTSLSERLRPHEVVRILNSYLGKMAEIILHYNGTIDEFIGDAILAIFGAPVQRPDDARRALACAVRMQRAMGAINHRHYVEGLPRIEMGVAVHTGEVVVGNIGSEKRAKYGVVGSTVNHTGRIESFTVGGQILVSAVTVEEAGPIVSVGERLTIEAKGAGAPLALYSLRGIGGEYGLFLHEREERSLPLSRPIDARYQILEGKGVGRETFTGTLVEVSRHGASMRCAQGIRPLSNLKMVLDPALGLRGDLYAKVLSGSSGAEDVARLHFTSVPPDAEAWLERTIAQGTSRRAGGEPASPAGGCSA